MLDHRQQIVQFRLPTQPDEMIAVRHDGAKVSRPTRRVTNLEFVPGDHLTAWTPPSRAAPFGGLTRKFRSDLRLVSKSKFHPKFRKQPGAGETATATSQGMINSANTNLVLSTYFAAGTDNSPDDLSKPSMKL